MPKITMKLLKAELAETQNRMDHLGNKTREATEAKEAAQEREKATRKQFDDLKFRLHNSEMEVARLNGYLSRVREDDVVREELVTIGDPEGGQRLVPKRKPEFLGNREPRMTDLCAGESYGYHNRAKPKHWIEY